MSPLPDSWQLREGSQLYTFYPAALHLHRWQAMCRIPWGREQWILPMYLCPGSPWRRERVVWEPEQRN